MENRIRRIREYYNLNQREFAKRINVGSSTLALFETGDRIPKDIHIKRICEEFNINEKWLRTGEGGDDSMFTQEFVENEYMAYATEIGNGASDVIKNAIVKYGRLSPENKKIIDDALNLLTEMLKEE